MRLNKYISETGVCSRREADKWIEAGRVTCNGQPAALGTKVAQGDQVRFNAIGVQGDNYQAWASAISGLGVTTSQSSYLLLEQPLVLGHQQVVEGSTA